MSKRTYEDGETIPKGGGTYKVGQPYRLNGRTYYPGEDPNYRAEGIASWYGPDFHGKLTANGERYDMHSISAAHTTLPIPSYARVTNLRNGHSIVVRVNDRGPYVGNRLIDLSVGAAKALDFYGEGLARVRVEYIGSAPIEGTDDRMLMATLRRGSPAPAPSLVMIASAKPFLPSLGHGGESGSTPVPAERPFTLGMPAPKVAAKTAAPEALPPERALAKSGLAVPVKPGLDAAPKVAARTAATGVLPPEREQAKSVVMLPVKPRLEEPPALAAGPSPAPNPAPISASAPVRPDGSLGLMSGRGLY